ncbi:MAG: YdcF family protein [Bacteroidales bacterium]|jgi:uncharacterized SAM-binding protein YcdF (DUF218 family)|nr:YdcF family protein [Bacteroidales bacterium]
MFFILSKILAFLFSPITWILALIALALFLRNPKLKKRFLIAALATGLFFTNSFIAKEFMRMWEPEPSSVYSIQIKYDAVIVLGGGIVTTNAQNKTLTFRNNPDRIMQALWLYKNDKADKILISGGSGSMQYPDMLESVLVRVFLIVIGLPSYFFYIYRLSKNTRENAVISEKILNDSIPGGEFLLITSASHMRRSIGCFRNVNLKVDPFPVDLTAGDRSWYWMNLLLPKTDALDIWDELLHEIIGYLTYRIVGYI